MIIGIVTPCAPAFFSWVADGCEFGGPALVSGGCYGGPDPYFGPFFLSGDDAEVSDPIAGARHLVSLYEV